MMTLRASKKTTLRLIAALGGCLAIVVVAFAQGTTTKIYSCVDNTTENIKIVTATATCKPAESPLAWDIQGPQGPQGPAGQGYTWRGEWDPRITYARYDNVSYGGSSYVAIAAPRPGTPPDVDRASWNLI